MVSIIKNAYELLLIIPCTGWESISHTLTELLKNGVDDNYGSKLLPEKLSCFNLKIPMLNGEKLTQESRFKNTKRQFFFFFVCLSGPLISK